MVTEKELSIMESIEIVFIAKNIAKKNESDEICKTYLKELQKEKFTIDFVKEGKEIIRKYLNK